MPNAQENDDPIDQVFRSALGDPLRAVLDHMINLPGIGAEIRDLLGNPQPPWPKGLSKDEMRKAYNLVYAFAMDIPGLINYQNLQFPILARNQG